MVGFRENFSNKELLNILKDGEQYLSNGGTFLDGHESAFSDAIKTYFCRHPNYASVFIEKEIRLKRFSDELFGEALRAIGRLDDDFSVYIRLQLLVNCLISDSTRVKDGALLGIASIDKPVQYVMIALQEAIDRETITPLKQSMQQVYDQLMQTKSKSNNEFLSDFNQMFGYETLGHEPYLAIGRIYYTNAISGSPLNRCFPNTWSAYVEFQNYSVANFELHNFSSKETLMYVVRSHYFSKLHALKNMDSEIRLQVVKEARALLDEIILKGNKL